MKPSAPCWDCPRRAPGCHNAETCPAWGEYQRAQEAYLTEQNRQKKETYQQIDYQQARRKYLKNRRNEK